MCVCVCIMLGLVVKIVNSKMPGRSRVVSEGATGRVFDCESVVLHLELDYCYIYDLRCTLPAFFLEIPNISHGNEI